jgi:propionyl-CoA synthetase
MQAHDAIGPTRRFDAIYRRSIDEPESFWADAAQAVHWEKRWDRVLDDRRPPFYRWFDGGQLNTCYNCVDRHVEEGRGLQRAVIYESPITGTSAEYTYSELQELTSRFAGALRALGVGRGERVLIYMPMIPQAVVAMLACARLGAIHSVVFGGFAAEELAARIDDAKPRVIVSASCGIEPSGVIPYKPLLDRAIDLVTDKPDACVIYQRPQVTAALSPGRDLDWTTVMESASPAPCVTVEATDPLYILYTSGTTGKPKGVVRDNGGHAVALSWSMKNIYDIEAGDVFWAASDVGWVVGHSYIVYAPLLAGATTIVFEGKPVGTPDPGVFWSIIEKHKVKALFTAPTAFRAIKREDPSGQYLRGHDLTGFKTLFLAGERLDPDTFHWAGRLLRVPVIDHWWQTETGWAICANCVGIEPLPVKPGSPTRPVPGFDVRVLDTEGNELSPPAEGILAIKLPLPPGCLTTLWHNDDGFIDSYLARYPGYYVTGDGGHIDEDGYVFVMGRVDDVINVAGHRLSTGRMEEVIAQHPDVAECAVVGVADELKGHVPMGLVILKAGTSKDPEELANELRASIRQQIGPVASFRRVVVVERLPKTRSGKILRRSISQIADGQRPTVPSTIDDPTVLDYLRTVIGLAPADAGDPGIGRA